MCSNDSTRSSVSDTVLLYVALAARSKHVTLARRGGDAPPPSNSRNSALLGSINSMDAYRQPRSPSAPGHTVLASQDRRDRRELVAAQRIQGVSHGNHATTSAAGCAAISGTATDSAARQCEALPRLAAVGVRIEFDTRPAVENAYRTLGVGVCRASPSPGTPVSAKARQRDCTSSLTRRAVLRSAAAVSSLPKVVR